MIIFFYDRKHSTFFGNIWIARMHICWSGTSRAALGHGGIEVWAICEDTKWPARLQIPRAAWIEPRKLPKCTSIQHESTRHVTFEIISDILNHPDFFKLWSRNTERVFTSLIIYSNSFYRCLPFTFHTHTHIYTGTDILLVLTSFPFYILSHFIC